MHKALEKEWWYAASHLSTLLTIVIEYNGCPYEIFFGLVARELII